MAVAELRASQPQPDLLNRIVAGDALAGLRAIDGADLFDLVIADPPYNIGKKFGELIDDVELTTYIDWCEQWLNECVRLVKESCPIYVYGYSEIIAHLAVRFPLAQQRWLNWHYKNKAVPSARFWQRSCETILCLWKGDRPRLNIDAIRIPYSDSYIKCGGRKRKSVPCRYNSKGKETVYHVHPAGALPRDLLEFPALAGGAGRNERWFLCKSCDQVFPPPELRRHDGHTVIKHPTQKPLKLSRQLIRSAIQGNGRLLVPFCGSGSECVMAMQLGVNYYGFELNPDYLKLARGWIEQSKDLISLNLS